MKKSIVLCTGLCVTLAFTACKPSESAYKKAYLKAQEANNTTTTYANNTYNTQGETYNTTTTPVTTTDVPVVTPYETQATETTVIDQTDNVRVTNENVELVSGSGLKSYSVVVGSFGVKANADGLVSRLRNAGYDAQLVKNPTKNMYRVVATSFPTKSEAVRSRNQLEANYPGAWLLYTK